MPKVKQEIDSTALQKNIKRQLRLYATAYMEQAAMELTKVAQIAIEKFYEDYTPLYYIRTYNLLHNSYAPFYRNDGYRVYGGVQLSSQDMEDYRYGASKQDILEWTWVQGYHGYSRRAWQEIRTTPPSDIIKQAMNDKKLLKRLDEAGRDVAKRGGGL